MNKCTLLKRIEWNLEVADKSIQNLQSNTINPGLKKTTKIKLSEKWVSGNGLNQQYYLLYHAPFFKTDSITLEVNVKKACQYQQHYLLYHAPFFKTYITLKAYVNRASQYQQYYLIYHAPFFKTDITLEANINKNRKTSKDPTSGALILRRNCNVQ